MALLETAYPELSKRFMSDVDILIRSRDLKQAINFLKGLGFESVGQTLTFIKKGEIPIRVDLHDRLWFFNQKRLWKNVQLKKEGSNLNVLSPEYNLLHIALHTILQDGIISDTSLKDGVALLQYSSEEWSWRRFVHLAREEGWGQTAGLYLNALHSFEPNVVPPGVLTDLICSFELEEQLLQKEKAVHGYSRMILGQEKRLKKMKLLWFILFPSIGFLRWRYSHIPSFLAWTLPFVRLAHLFLNYAKLLACRS